MKSLVGLLYIPTMMEKAGDLASFEHLLEVPCHHAAERGIALQASACQCLADAQPVKRPADNILQRVPFCRASREGRKTPAANQVTDQAVYCHGGAGILRIQ